MAKKVHTVRFTRPEDRRASLCDTEKEIIKLRKEWKKEDLENLLILCGEYQLPKSVAALPRLALAMAREFLPKLKKGGNTKKWTPLSGGCLVAEINRLRDENVLTIKVATELLAQSTVWHEFLYSKDETVTHGPDQADALMAQYKKYKKSGFVYIFTGAYNNIKKSGDTDKWDELIVEVLSFSKKRHSL